MRAIPPKFAICSVFVAAMFMTIMDSTVVQVALPTLARDFSVTIDGVSGLVTGYLVTLAVVMPASGWVGDRFGTRRVLLGSLGLFTAASALSGLAQNLEQLVAFRCLQGIGGGMLVPAGMAMLYRTFEQSERIRVNRLLMIPTLIAPAVGPVLGGALVDGLSWRWIFYINVPIGVAAVVFGVLTLPAGEEHPPGRFDLPGFLLVGTGFPLLMYALSEGATDGWGSPAIVASGAAGLALLSAFVTVELRVDEPILRLGILRDRMFRIGNCQSVFASAGFLGILFLVPLFLQDGLGFSALHSGLSTFTEALGGLTGIQISARIYRKVGPRRLMAGGQMGAVATIGSMAAVGPSQAHWLIPVLMCLTGTSIGFAMAPATTVALVSISSAATAQATTLYNTQRQAGSAGGVAVLATVLAVTHASAAKLAGYHVAFVVGAGFMVFAVLVSSRIRDADAAPTMAAPAQPVPDAVGSA